MLTGITNFRKLISSVGNGHNKFNTGNFMMKLHRFFQNPFDDPSFGVGKLLAFTNDHLAKMAAVNPGGILDARISATTAALQAVSSADVDDLNNMGWRKGQKGEKRKFRKALPGSIGKIYGAAVAKFGPKTPEMKELFPSGRSAFIKCRDAVLEDELGVLITALTAHQSELGPEVLASAEALASGWQAVYEGSESSMAAKAHTEKARRDARAALQQELFLNLLALAQNFPRQPEKLNSYMQQSLLEKHPRVPKPRPSAG